jgi:hypothetical protein
VRNYEWQLVLVLVLSEAVLVIEIDGEDRVNFIRIRAPSLRD